MLKLLYLAEHVYEQIKLYFGCLALHWLHGRQCVRLFELVDILGNHDINIGVHLLDWEMSVKKDIQRYGFELVSINGKEIAKETEDASDFEGLQYIFPPSVLQS